MQETPRPQPPSASEFFGILVDVHARLHEAGEAIPEDENEVRDVREMLSKILDELNRHQDQILAGRKLTVKEFGLLGEIDLTIGRLLFRLARVTIGLRQFAEFESSAVQ
jgi:hypothetical protein